MKLKMHVSALALAASAAFVVGGQAQAWTLEEAAKPYAGTELEVLFLDRDDDNHLLMPAADTPIRAGDELLLAGTRDALNDVGLIIAHEHTLAYILSGEDLPGGWIWERLARRKHAPSHARLP